MAGEYHFKDSALMNDEEEKLWFLELLVDISPLENVSAVSPLLRLKDRQAEYWPPSFAPCGGWLGSSSSVKAGLECLIYCFRDSWALLIFNVIGYYYWPVLTGPGPVACLWWNFLYGWNSSCLYVLIISNRYLLQQLICWKCKFCTMLYNKPITYIL